MSAPRSRAHAARIGIFYHTDPAGNVPSGIDSFIRGILQWAPPELNYLLFGASSDPETRPVGRMASFQLGERELRYLPLINVDPAAARSRIPHTLQFMQAVRRLRRDELISGLEILDFHRIEPAWLFRDDARPRNVVLHQDMSVIRDKNSDIMWRHMPWVYETFERSVLSGVQHTFCVRESAVARYAALYPRLAARFSFIPTWVDTGTFHPAAGEEARALARAAVRSQLGVGAGVPLLVFVGRLDRQKDPALLLAAMQQLLERRNDAHLLIIGDGTLRAAVASHAAQAPLAGHVTLAGALSRTQIAAHLRGADLFVMSSAYEGMPIAVLEALASGVPVVSTAVGELSRVIVNGVNGYLVQERSADALAAAFDVALQGADRMGANCVASIQPYQPEAVLGLIYANHLRQLQGGMT